MKTYDPAKQLMSFAGNLLTGFAEGTFIKVTRNEDSFTYTPGAGGEGTRSMNRNRSGTVEVTILASSPTNDILSAIAAADELSGSGVSPIFSKEFNGTSNFVGQNAWVKRMPDYERAKEAGVVVWLFEVQELEIFNGGLLT